MTIGELEKSLLTDAGLNLDPPDVAGVIDLLRLHTVAGGLINPPSDSQAFWDQLLKTWMAVILHSGQKKFSPTSNNSGFSLV